MTPPHEPPHEPPRQPARAPAEDGALPRLRVAKALVRGWTRVYTWRLPPTLREARLAEIESDLWEFQQDTAAHRGLDPGLHVLIRLVSGIPDDVSWRAEQATLRQALGYPMALAAVATAIILAALWVLPVMLAQPLPPVAPPSVKRVFMPTPPPPPPPPRLPPGLTPACQ